MWWLLLIVVVGITLGMACCCDGVCLDCSSSDIEGLTIALTIAGVTGGDYCLDSATTCADGWNGTHMLTYSSGVGTAICEWSNTDATYPGDCTGGSDQGREFWVTAVNTGIIEARYNRTGSGNKAEFSFDNGAILDCDFDEALSLDANPEADNCDHSAATANAATV